jgi:prepilin-type processing-associated H-X9-DG protein
MADGAFVHRETDKGRTLAEIVDGLSNTVAMSECLTGNGQRNFDHSRDLWYSAGAVLDPNWNHSSEWMARTCRMLGDAVPTSAYSSLQGRFLLDASYANTEYNHIFLPNAREASCSADRVPQPHTGEDPSQGTWFAAIKASSNHSGQTVNVLMMDGSVANATAQMSLEIWQNMARIDDSK